MIGIFDSGVGGLSVYREIKKIFPETKIVYLSDKKHFPYGEKTEKELEMICKENITFLQQQGSQLMVVACNSATVTTIRALREVFDLPIVGIEPALKMASELTKNGKIGLIATKRTIEGHDGERWLKKGQEVYKVHSADLVSQIENNFNEVSDMNLLESLDELIQNEVDCIALGCTHYHFLKDRFRHLYPNVTFLSPDRNVALRVKDLVDEKGIKLENGSDVFFATKDREMLAKFVKNVLGVQNADVREV